MNELQNRRIKEQMDKEKQMRRDWIAHDAQQQVYEPASESMAQLNTLRDTMDNLCADPSRTSDTALEERPSRRKQLVALRNDLRESIKHVDAKLATVDAESQKVDAAYEDAKAAAKERAKLPMHLRGSFETLV